MRGAHSYSDHIHISVTSLYVCAHVYFIETLVAFWQGWVVGKSVCGVYVCVSGRGGKGAHKGKERWIFSKCHHGCTNACFVHHSNSIITMEDGFQLSYHIQVSCPHIPASFRHKDTADKWPLEASERLNAKSYCSIDLIAIHLNR